MEGEKGQKLYLTKKCDNCLIIQENFYRYSCGHNFCLYCISKSLKDNESGNIELLIKETSVMCLICSEKSKVGRKIEQVWLNAVDFIFPSVQDLYEMFNDQNSVIDYLYFIEHFFVDDTYESSDYMDWIETYDFRVIFVMNPRNADHSFDDNFRTTLKSQNFIYSDSMSKLFKSSLKKEENQRDSVGSILESDNQMKTITSSFNKTVKRNNNHDQIEIIQDSNNPENLSPQIKTVENFNKTDYLNIRRNSKKISDNKEFMESSPEFFNSINFAKSGIEAEEVVSNVYDTNVDEILDRNRKILSMSKHTRSKTFENCRRYQSINNRETILSDNSLNGGIKNDLRASSISKQDFMSEINYNPKYSRTRNELPYENSIPDFPKTISNNIFHSQNTNHRYSAKESHTNDTRSQSHLHNYYSKNDTKAALFANPTSKIDFEKLVAQGTAALIKKEKDKEIYNTVCIESENSNILIQNLSKSEKKNRGSPRKVVIKADKDTKSLSVVKNSMVNKLGVEDCEFEITISPKNERFSPKKVRGLDVQGSPTEIYNSAQHHNFDSKGNINNRPRNIPYLNQSSTSFNKAKLDDNSIYFEINGDDCKVNLPDSSYGKVLLSQKNVPNIKNTSTVSYINNTKESASDAKYQEVYCLDNKKHLNLKKNCQNKINIDPKTLKMEFNETNKKLDRMIKRNLFKSNKPKIIKKSNYSLMDDYNQDIGISNTIMTEDHKNNVNFDGTQEHVEKPKAALFSKTKQHFSKFLQNTTHLNKPNLISTNSTKPRIKRPELPKSNNINSDLKQKLQYKLINDMEVKKNSEKNPVIQEKNDKPNSQREKHGNSNERLFSFGNNEAHVIKELAKKVGYAKSKAKPSSEIHNIDRSKRNVLSLMSHNIDIEIGRNSKKRSICEVSNNLRTENSPSSDRFNENNVTTLKKNKFYEPQEYRDLKKTYKSYRVNEENITPKLDDSNILANNIFSCKDIYKSEIRPSSKKRGDLKQNMSKIMDEMKNLNSTNSKKDYSSDCKSQRKACANEYQAIYHSNNHFSAGKSVNKTRDYLTMMNKDDSFGVLSVQKRNRIANESLDKSNLSMSKRQPHTSITRTRMLIEELGQSKNAPNNFNTSYDGFKNSTMFSEFNQRKHSFLNQNDACTTLLKRDTPFFITKKCRTKFDQTNKEKFEPALVKSYKKDYSKINRISISPSRSKDRNRIHGRDIENLLRKEEEIQNIKKEMHRKHDIEKSPIRKLNSKENSPRAIYIHK